MTFSIFLFVLLNAYLSFNLFHPNIKSQWFFAVSFALRWLVAELAPFYLILQVFITLILLYQDSFNGFFGTLGIFSNIISWYFCWKHYQQGTTFDQLFHNVFIKNMGKHYKDEIAPQTLQSIPQSVSIERLMKPFSVRLPEVGCKRNIEYDMPEGKRLCLDIFYNKTEEITIDSKKPVLVQIHGGAWLEIFGQRERQAMPLINHMAKNGWVVVNISYRLSPRFAFPAHIRDCKKAITWVKENIAEHGGDPDFIAVTGGSAGGHLSSLVALSANDPAFQEGFEEQDTSVQACVPFYGVYDLSNEFGLHNNKGLVHLLEQEILQIPLKSNRDIFQKASPMFRVHDKAPPFFIMHGEKDCIASTSESAMFAKRLAEVSRSRVNYVELPGASHAFDCFVSLRSEHAKHAVHTFLSYEHALYKKAQS